MDYKGFERGKITVFESFSGVGGTRLALNNIGCNVEIVGISETNFDSIIMYDSLHNDSDSSSDLSDEEMLEWIESRNIGKDVFSFYDDGKYGLKEFYEANIRCKNYGDIALINPNDLEDFDLMTYRFKPKFIPDMINGEFVHYSHEPTGQVSGCSRIISSKKPKHLLFESDDGTVGAKYEKDFERWLNFLEGLGYKNYRKDFRYKEFDTPQNKKRTFVYSTLSDDEFEMPTGADTNLRLKDFLEKTVSRKFFLRKEFEMLSEDFEDYHCKPFVVAKMIEHNEYLNLSRVISRNGICTAIQSSFGGGKVPKVLVRKSTQMKGFSIDGMTVREITPLEAWRLSGYSDKDFKKLSKKIKQKTILYTNAGRSSNPKILEAIFKTFLKEEIEDEGKEINK